jgi:hypothetical protein
MFEQGDPLTLTPEGRKVIEVWAAYLIQHPQIKVTVHGGAPTAGEGFSRHSSELGPYWVCEPCADRADIVADSLDGLVRGKGYPCPQDTECFGKTFEILHEGESAKVTWPRGGSEIRIREEEI